MKIVFFTDTHIGFHENKNMIFHIFDECLQYARSVSADLIVHTGDLFDVKHVSSQVIRQTIDILTKNSIRPLSDQEQIFPHDPDDLKYVSRIGKDEMKNHIPMVMICGNHEDKNVLKLLPVTVLDSQDKKEGREIKILPYIIKINNEILVLYGSDYIRNFEMVQNRNRLTLVTPVAAFDKNITLLENYGVSSLVLLHQNCNKLTSMIKSDFIIQLNHSISNDIQKSIEKARLLKHQNKLQVNFVINGHEHAQAYEQCTGDIVIIMPGTFTQTKRDNKLDNFINKGNKSLLVAEVNNNIFEFKDHHIFLQQIAASCQLDIDIDNNVYNRDMYLELIYLQINEMLKKCINFYSYLIGNQQNPSLDEIQKDQELMHMLDIGYNWYLQNNSQLKKNNNRQLTNNEQQFLHIRNLDGYITALIQAIQEQDFTAFRHYLLPKPNIKLVISVKHLNRKNYLDASSILLEDELQKRYFNIFGNFNNRILHLHDVQQETSLTKSNDYQQVLPNTVLIGLLDNQQNNQFEEEYQIASIEFKQNKLLGHMIQDQLQSVCHQADDDDNDDENETNTRTDKRNKKINIEKQQKEQLQKVINDKQNELIQKLNAFENDVEFGKLLKQCLDDYRSDNINDEDIQSPFTNNENVYSISD